MDEQAHSAAGLLTPREAAALLKISRRTLEVWRSRGWGPPVVMLTARSVRYCEGDLRDWLSERRRGEGTA